MFVKMETAIMHVTNFVIDKNVLAEAIFEKKMFKAVSKKLRMSVYM